MSNIRLFRPTETNFTHNEWVLNEIISCKPIEGINDDYTTELEYPLEDSKSLSSNLVVGSIVSIPTLDNRPDQLFRIIDKDTSSTTITVQMQAKLLADLKENRVRAMTLTGLTRKQAIQAILNATLDPHTYSVGNLDTNANTNVIVNIPEGSVLSALIGAENSILSEYGGEFIVNNNTIDIVDSRGSDNGVVIEYGKNISSISEKINNTDLATVLIPKSGEYRLPEYSIESPLVGAYEKRYFKEVDMNLNIWNGENEKGDDQVTLTEAYTLMRATCNKMFTVDRVDQMAFNYTVDFVQLSQTEEYKNYAILETVNLGDTVTIKHSKLNLNLQGRVNKIAYRVDSEGITTIDTVEIGFSRKDITDIIKTAVKSIKFTKDEIMLSVNNSISDVNATLDIQAEKISAVVQSKGVGMGWTLNQEEFKVACIGSSGASVTINENGLTVDDGKFKIKKSGSTKFYVNTSGRCTADGGFIVDDGDASCVIDSNGVKITNLNGYTGLLTVSDDYDRLEVPSAFYVYEFLANTADIKNDLQVEGDFTVDGSKNCVQQTINYGKRLINAYETAEYYFGDIGEGIIENGQCPVPIEAIFKECINTDVPYQVFIQAYSGNVTSVERYKDNFIVKGTNGTTFAWEIKAKRRGYENIRLEEKLIREGD